MANSRMICYRIGRVVAGQTKNNPGDIAGHEAEGFYWGDSIENGDGFMKIEVTGLPKKEFNMENHPQQNPVSLLVPLFEWSDPNNPTIVQYKRFQVDFGRSNISAQDTNINIDVNDLKLTDKAGNNPPNKQLDWDSITEEWVL